MSMHILQPILVCLQVVADDVRMGLRELLVRRNNHMRRRAPSLMCLVVGTQIQQDTIAILRKILNRFDRAEQSGIDVAFSQKLCQCGRRSGDEFCIMKEIDAVPILGKHGKKRERRGAGAAKDAKLLAFQVHWCFDRRILPHEHHVHWREDAVDDNDVFAFAACGGHRCEPTEPDVDLSFCDHEMQIRGAQRFHFVRFQANLIEQAVSFHDEIDELLRSGGDAQFERAGGRRIGLCGWGASDEEEDEQRKAN